MQTGEIHESVTEAVTAAKATAEGRNLMELTLVVQLTIGTLGTRQKVDPDRVDTDADKDLLHVGKDILSCDELRDLRTNAGEIRKYIRSRSLPSVLKGGMYLLPLALVEEVDTRLQEMKHERKALADAFLDAYCRPDGLIATAKKRLGDLFDPADYPSPARVRAAFTWDVRFMTFDTPAKLRSISRAMFDREREKAERAWAQASVEVTKLLRTEAKALVDHMVERLTPGSDGKPRVFRGTLVSNFSDFLGTFPFRNVTGDEQLADICAKAKRLLEGVSPEDLRDHDQLRADVAAGMAGIKAQLDTMVTEKPKRLIQLELDE